MSSDISDKAVRHLIDVILAATGTTSIRHGQVVDIIAAAVQLLPATEAAPVPSHPFEVGKPLTTEMGEPPVGTLLQWTPSFTFASPSDSFWMMGDDHNVIDTEGEPLAWSEFGEHEQYTVRYLPESK